MSSFLRPIKAWVTRAVVGRTPVGRASGEPDADFESGWRLHFKTRLLMVLAVLGFWAAALEARLIYLQVVQHEDYVQQARAQQQEIIEPAGDRGDIVDRNGEILAYSVEGHQLRADPALIEDPALEVKELCAALGDCSAAEQKELLAKLSRKGRYPVLRKSRDLSPDAVGRIRALVAARAKAKRPTVFSLVAESHRYYPKFDLASHVVGFVGGEGKGGGGIEAKYDSVIAGARGRVLVQVDGRSGGREIATHVERAPTVGASLELTLDLRLQHIAERELRAGIQEFQAASGSVVILDPNTGEILAQASYPSFNPNVYFKASADERRNRAVQDIYEPGSTFKLVTASAALNERVFAPSESIDTSPGVIRIQGRKPIDEADGHNYGVLTFEDVIIKSSNVGAIRIGQRLGGTRMSDYVRRFGFGETLAPDFAGESRGQLRAADAVDDSVLASMSMGYEIGVTPLQLAVAASVVANGGVLVEPRVVRAVIRGGKRDVVEPRVLRRVITPETAATVTAIMEGVTERGTAKAAALTRYQVAGKTGTASKVVNGAYSSTDYNVSFVGFVPSRKPALTILVVLDTPRKGRAYGGVVAAPVFKRIAEASLQQLGVAPSINPAPPIVTTAHRGVVPDQPSRSAEILPAVMHVGDSRVMPDVRGMSLRDALRVTNALGLRMTTDGDGIVMQQVPEPGAIVDTIRAGSLHLGRFPLAARIGR